MSENASPAEIPVALLSQALLELRRARGNLRAEREAAIRYFKSGVANGYQVGPLLQWLFFWPNNRESVFWQARLDSRFVEMLKKLTLQDLGLAPDDAAAAAGEILSSLNTQGSGPAPAEPLRWASKRRGAI